MQLGLMGWCKSISLGNNKVSSDNKFLYSEYINGNMKKMFLFVVNGTKITFLLCASEKGWSKLNTRKM